jgi:hypothetical protein
MRTQSWTHRVPGAVLLAVLLFSSAQIGATPLRLGTSKGPTRFKDGTTVTVYIPVDPSGGGREKGLADGVKAWNNEKALMDHNIKIQVMAGQAPAGATNAVQVNWKAPTGSELGEATTASMEGPNGDNTTTGGTIDISPDTTDVDNNMATNLGIHEMGHILGLDDTPNTATAMDPDFNKNSKLKITNKDNLELTSTFAVSNGKSSDQVFANVSFTGGLYDYSYTLNWLSGIDLALFQVDTNGANLQSITAPTGWGIDTPIGNDVTIAVDGLPQTQEFVSFVLLDETSYLGPDHPQLDFSFESSNAPGNVEAFLSGVTQTMGPAAVPEPGTFALTMGGLAALFVRQRRRFT